MNKHRIYSAILLYWIFSCLSFSFSLPLYSLIIHKEYIIVVIFWSSSLYMYPIYHPYICIRALYHPYICIRALLRPTIWGIQTSGRYSFIRLAWRLINDRLYHCFNYTPLKRNNLAERFVSQFTFCICYA